MGVPSSRTPVRVARGTYANLSTTNALAALQEGEICFATDQDKLYVKEGAGLTSISASSTASPAPSNITASPAFVSGTGTQADPFVVTSAAVPFSGGTAESAQEITLTGTAGDFVIFTDNSVSASGNRFSGQVVGNVDSGGTFKFKLKYEDTPGTTVNNTTYNGLVQIGTAHFSFTVVQSNLTALSQLTATTVAGTGGAGNVLTCTPGTATGGTGTITYATRWQRSFNGIDGFFDINGANATTYTQTNSDAGFFVRAVTTATDSTPAGQGGPLTLELPSSVTAQIPSGAAPVINNVVLSEDDTTGARFTSSVYSADVTMVNDGSPVSQKAVKGSVQASFTVNSQTSALTSYNQSVTTNFFNTTYNGNTIYFGNSNRWTYTYVADHTDDYRVYAWKSEPGNFYCFGLDNNFGTTTLRQQTVTQNYGSPYLDFTQVCNRNGLLYFHGTNNNSMYNYYLYGFLTQADDISNSWYFSRHETPSACDGKMLWWFDTSGNIKARYNYNDTTNYDLSLPGAFSTATSSGTIYAMGTGALSGHQGGFAHVISGDKLVLLSYNGSNNRVETYTWDINRQSGVTPDSTWLTYRGYVNTNAGSFSSSYDFGTFGFYAIVYDNSSGWGIYKYNTTNRTLERLSGVPSGLQGGERLGLGCDKQGNIHLAGFKSGDTNYFRFYRSTNGGYSWQQVTTEVYSPSSWSQHYLRSYIDAGDFEIWGSVLNSTSSANNVARPYRVFNNQTATVTSASLNVFGDSEAITKLGDENNVEYKGTLEVTNRSAGQIRLFTSGLWQNGDVVVSRVGGSTQSATKYLVLDSVGNVTNISSSDPGFTTLGPGTAIDLTFPATLPSGNAPDTELPAGASLQVQVQATNSASSDTFTSNSVTPT